MVSEIGDESRVWWEIPAVSVQGSERRVRSSRLPSTAQKV